MSCRLIINGADGNMGRELQTLAKNDDRFEIVGLADVCHPYKPLREHLLKCDCIIDFSTPSALDELLSYAQTNNIPIVIGTTGFDKEQYKKIVKATENIPIILSPNYSVGVKVFENALSLIKKGFPKADTCILESHRRNKKDKPSGTAIRLANIIKERDGKGKEVEVLSLRMGELYGEHTVYFTSDCEQITITHRAFSRKCFAEGALMSALSILEKDVGLYSFT